MAQTPPQRQKTAHAPSADDEPLPIATNIAPPNWDTGEGYVWEINVAPLEPALAEDWEEWEEESGGINSYLPRGPSMYHFDL